MRWDTGGLVRVSKSEKKLGLKEDQVSKLKRIAELELQLKTMGREAQGLGLSFEAYLLDMAAMAFNKKFQELSKREQ